jgi:hypothetical protein
VVIGGPVELGPTRPEVWGPGGVEISGPLGWEPLGPSGWRPVGVEIQLAFIVGTWQA